MPRVFIYVAHNAGVPDDSLAELAAAARVVDPSAAPTALVCGNDSEVDVACATAASFCSEVWKLDHIAFAHPNAELVRQALVAIVPRGSIVLAPHQHFGIDLCPGLAIKLGAAFVSDVIEIRTEASDVLTVVRSEFGGQFNTHVRCEITSGAVLTIRPGAFKAGAPAVGSGTLVDKSSSFGALSSKRRYVETLIASAGDVDITREPVLIAIGRGIQGQENIQLAEELAEAMGGVVCCSRPVADAQWLDKSRQVGSSGRTVKPRVYLACGISGSFQHLAGIKGGCLIAINKNPNAPIFQAAEIGVVDDLLKFLPALTAHVAELREVAAQGARR